jgi:hypothetical protein
MPIRKFRSIEEMKEPHWRSPGDPELFRAMAGLWEVAWRTSRRHYPPGVHRHRSIEEMQRVQEGWSETRDDV